MPTGTISQVASIAGLSIQATVTRTETGQIGHEIDLSEAQAGTLTTRTDDDTGIVTLSSGHGITTSDTVDVYWSGGVQYNCTVTAYDATTITIDAGDGDVLPAQDTVVTACAHTTVDTDFDGDLLEMIAGSANYRSHVCFMDAAHAVLLAVELIAGELWSWSADSGITNPLASDDVAYCRVSNGDSDYESTVKLGILYDSAS